MNADISETQEEIDSLADEGAGAGTGDGTGDGGEGAGENRSGLPAGGERGFNPIASYGVGAVPQAEQRETDPLDTEEYRTAFMEFVCRNKPIPENLREADYTMMADGSAVIPTTILNEIIKELKVYGNIWSKVRKLNIAAGVSVPILTLLPEAKWHGENETTGYQKIKADEKVSFGLFGLECKMSQTLFASVMTLKSFQEMFVPLAVEAITKALEVAIISGDGKEKPLGILNDARVPTENVIEMTAEELRNWSAWRTKVFAKMKKAYKKGYFFMAEGTYQGEICGQVDSVGRPIARTTIGISDGVETYRYNGKVVETVEDDIITPVSSAKAGDVVAMFADLTKYAINSPLQLRTIKWVDNDTSELRNKLEMICDGKLLDPYGVLIIKLKDEE